MKTKFTERLKLVALVFLVLMTCALYGQHDNINTIAGNGSKGFSGDGGPAMTAKLSSPHGAGFDDHGHGFIAGRDNKHIGMVDINTAVIATIAANGMPGLSGDAGLAALANLILARHVFVRSHGYDHKAIDLSSGPSGIYMAKVPPAGQVVYRSKIIRK